MIKKTAPEIWQEYNKIIAYKTTFNLYDTVKTNQNFYLGKQWEGVNAPDIEKPVINVLRQGVDYYVSNLASDDIGVQVILPEETPKETKDTIQFIVSKTIDDVFEKIKFKTKQRVFLKNCAIDGDACNYFWFNTSKGNQDVALGLVGEIDHELIDNTNIGFGNPVEQDEQKQPYIILIQKLPIEKVKEMAKEAGVDPEYVKPDSEDYNQQETDAQAQETYTTVLTKLFKENGTIHAIKCCKDVVLMKEKDLELRYYPISYQSWNRRKNSYHGESPLTNQIQNQIMINKYYMMINEFLKKTAFPKLLYDGTKIGKWSNKVESIKVDGDPTNAVFSSSPTMAMNQQASQFLQDLIDKTKETMGVFDVALGNARPENTSAIIALQKTASQPLELQKLDYYQMIENSVRIILDIVSVSYGIQQVDVKAILSPEEMQNVQMAQQALVPADPMNPQPLPMPDMEDNEVSYTIPFDYADINPEKLNFQVEIGASAYWSEIMQIQTLDNMYRAGIIPDAITYIEQMPNGVLKSKQDIIDAIKKKQAQDAQLAMQQMAQTQGIPQGS